MPTANVHEAKTHLSKLIDAALRGEEVIIARNGKPAVKLVPVEPEPRTRVAGMWKDKVVVVDPDWWKPDDELADLFGIPRLPAEDEPPRE